MRRLAITVLWAWIVWSRTYYEGGRASSGDFWNFYEGLETKVQCEDAAIRRAALFGG